MSIITAIVGYLTGGFVDKIVDLGKAYFQKETDQAEFESKVRIAAQEAAAEVEKGWAQATADITKSVQSTLAASPILQRAWASVMFLEVTVLVWYQIGAPAYRVITGVPWPEPGISLEWAYLLIASMIGAGPFVFKRGSVK